MKKLKVYFGRHSLDLPKEEISQNKIKKDTPQISFLRKHKRDIAEECAALEYLINLTEDSPKRIYDLMAGCGFSGKILAHRWPEVPLFLNDLSPKCVQILQENFQKPFHTVTNQPAAQVKILPNSLIWIDFNTFTLKKIQTWKQELSNAFSSQPSSFYLTDCANYAFKFGDVFLHSYQINSPEEYYEKLSQYFYAHWKWAVARVVVFRNAAVIELKKSKTSDYPIQIFPGPGLLPISIQIKGFDL